MSENRLLSRDEAKAVILKKHCSPETQPQHISITDVEYSLMEAQDAKTARILQAECESKVRERTKEIRTLFLKYLTQDSETHDARRKEFNQAIFDDKEGFAIWSRTDFDMIMDKFDKAIKELRSK